MSVAACHVADSARNTGFLRRDPVARRSHIERASSHISPFLDSHRPSFIFRKLGHARSFSIKCGTPSGRGITAGGPIRPTSIGFGGTSSSTRRSTVDDGRRGNHQVLIVAGDRAPRQLVDTESSAECRAVSVQARALHRGARHRARAAGFW